MSLIHYLDVTQSPDSCYTVVKYALEWAFLQKDLMIWAHSHDDFRRQKAIQHVNMHVPFTKPPPFSPPPLQPSIRSPAETRFPLFFLQQLLIYAINWMPCLYRAISSSNSTKQCGLLRYIYSFYHKGISVYLLDDDADNRPGRLALYIENMIQF